MKKYIISLALISAFCLLASTSFSEELYMGNSRSRKFHYPTCRYTKTIAPRNLAFFKSYQEAIKAGFIACKICKPSDIDYINEALKKEEK